MKILIDQAGFINKGAELMLCSVVEKLKQQYPEAQLLIPQNEANKGRVEYCSEKNILPVRSGVINKLLISLYRACAKRNIISKNKARLFVHSSEVDVVIDAGGFRFGDQWKFNAIECWLIKRYYNSFRRNCKIIFLPQSFGPFKEKNSIKSVQTALKHAGLAYPREDVSMEYLKEVAPKSCKLELKRDFTLLHKHDTFLTGWLKDDNYVAVAVNQRMVTHSSLGEGTYIEFICKLIKTLHDKGEKIYLLNHEGVGDKRICEEINRRLNLSLPIMSDLRALQVKNIIGNAKLVVSSRFHGVVSGIVQRVPTFCTSWSHKYNELLSVYGLDNNILELNSADKSISKVLDALEHPQKYITKEAILEQERGSIEQMWQDIFAFIENR